jgi:hypothetical protein
MFHTLGFAGTAGVLSGLVIVGGFIPTLIIQMTAPRE